MKNFRLLYQSVAIWFAKKDLHSRRADFYYDLGATLEDRVPLVTTLRKLEMRARMRKPEIAPLYVQMLKSLQTGSLSYSLQGIATPMEQTLIDATQAAGDSAMADGLLFMSTMVEKTDKMLVSIRKALLLPCGLLLMFSAMLVAFSLSAVPVLAELMPPERWPASGRVLYFFSNLIASYGQWIGAGILGLISLFVYSLPRWTGSSRKWLDKRFPYSLYRDYSGSLLLISISSMMRSGISLRSALERSMRFCSPWTRWHIRKILSNLAKPGTPHFGQAFSTGLLSVQLEDRVQDASERRDPVEAFVRMGINSVDRMALYIDRRASQLNTIMLIVCGVILGMMMIGFFSTAMSLQSGLKESVNIQNAQ